MARINYRQTHVFQTGGRNIKTKLLILLLFLLSLDVFKLLSTVGQSSLIFFKKIQIIISYIEHIVLYCIVLYL